MYFSTEWTMISHAKLWFGTQNTELIVEFYKTHVYDEH